jgi:hypothetical protein
MSRSNSTYTTAEQSSVEQQRQRVPVSGGVLVYEQRELGRELVGFEDVTSWSDLTDAVAAKGHSRGDALHLPVLDAEGN